MWQQFWQRSFGHDNPGTEHTEWLRCLLAASALSLVFATWGLWWPTGSFPQVPWFAWGCAVPVGVDRILLLVLLGSLASVLVTVPREKRPEWGLLIFAAVAIGLMLLNQQRTQPWMYHLVLMALVLATTGRQFAFGLLRLLTVGIYTHSGVSKLDVSFCAGLGDLFWQTARNLILGGNTNRIPGFSLWPLLFPIGEILIAMGLIWPRTRRFALWGACAMHGTLLLMLSPWGLNHRPGVLLWNMFFLLQDLFLFSGPTANSAGVTPTETVAATPCRRNYLVAASKFMPPLLVAGCLIWPFAEPWGGCDVWLAWGLYAEHGEQLTIIVPESGLRKLPPIWHQSAAPWQDGIDARQSAVPLWKLRIKNVSLEKLTAPVYPANRFLLGVALQIAQDSELKNHEIAAIWESPANRWTGVRQTRKLANLTELQQAADRCWLNARPRMKPK